jgi:hypothetical protein
MIGTHAFQLGGSIAGTGLDWIVSDLHQVVLLLTAAAIPASGFALQPPDVKARQKPEGPFLDGLSFAESLLPLAVFELYWRARDQGGPVARTAVAAGLVALTAAMGTGIFGAFVELWLPNT